MRIVRLVSFLPPPTRARRGLFRDFFRQRAKPIVNLEMLIACLQVVGFAFFCFFVPLVPWIVADACMVEAYRLHVLKVLIAELRPCLQMANPITCAEVF